MVRILLSTVVAAIIGLSTATFVNAQTGPATPPPAVNPSIQTPGTNPAPQAGISEVEILALLKQLDPNVQTIKYENGVGYRLTVKADGWAYSLNIEVYGTNIWLNSELGSPIMDVSHVPSNALAELLAANLKVGPTHFAYNKLKTGGWQLSACRQVLRPVTANAFGAQLSQFCKDIRETYPQWNAVISVK